MTKMGAVGLPGHRVTPVIRLERGNRIYFQWPRPGRSKADHKGGYTKLSSPLTWPDGVKEQAKLMVTVLERAEAISHARAAGATDEVLRRLAQGEGPDAPVAPAVLTVRDVMALAIGPSPRHLLRSLRAADAEERRRRDEARAAREAEKAARAAKAPKRRRKQTTERSPRPPKPPRRPGLSAKSCAALQEFWQQNPPPKTGIYSAWTQQAKTARALADEIEDTLGAERSFMSLTSNEQKLLFTDGVRDNAEKRVSVLLRVGRWAERQYLVSHGYRAPLPFSPTWQQDIRKATRGENTRPRRPRYSVRETGRVWRILSDPASPINPMLRLAALVGGEARLGQVLKLRTADCKRVMGAWMAKPPQSGKKATAWIMVPLDLQGIFDEAVTAAEQRADPRIFPISRRNAITAWKKIEKLADVPRVGWNALRRAMTEICPKAKTALVQEMRNTDDPLDHDNDVLLKVISGHIPVEITDSVYRDLPVGDKDAPEPGSVAYEVLIDARRIVQRARAMAVERVDAPF